MSQSQCVPLSHSSTRGLSDCMHLHYIQVLDGIAEVINDVLGKGGKADASEWSEGALPNFSTVVSVAKHVALDPLLLSPHPCSYRR